MFEKKVFPFYLVLVVIGSVLLVAANIAGSVSAQTLNDGIDNGNCMICHEDLYFLHDTGKYFCIREAPMRCVDCHGGDPTAVTQEAAHLRLSTHPAVIGAVIKCRECHPSDCDERVTIFSEVAGVSEVKVSTSLPGNVSSVELVEQPKPAAWHLLLEFRSLVVIASLALIIYFVQKARLS